MNVFKNQWRELITNKKLLISVIGVLFIPLIYKQHIFGGVLVPIQETSISSP